MKRFRLVEGQEAEECLPKDFSWDACIFCQNDTKEGLVCPLDSKRSDRGAGYASVAQNLSDYNELGALPPSSCMSQLDDGSGVEATLNRHCAKWHKSCRDAYNSTKLDRLRKRKHGEFSQIDSVVPAGVTLGPTTPSCSSYYTRSFSAVSEDVVANCLFCGKSSDFGTLHSVCTFEVDFRVRKCAFILQDSELLAKISGGDLIALEAKYHSPCLLALYRRASSESENSTVTTDVTGDSIAFAQLVQYISEVQNDSATAPVFKLSELAKKYQARLQQIGSSTRVHASRLKEQLLLHFRSMRAQTSGKQVLLVFDEDIGSALTAACQFDSDLDAMYLVKAAQIVRRHIFQTTEKFCGSFKPDCQKHSVPQQLADLVQMILEGPSIDCQGDVQCVPAVLSISQLLVFNAVKFARKQTEVMKVRHSVSQETPLPLYMSLMLHAETRKRELIDKLFAMGLCVSYDRVLQVSAGLSNQVHDNFNLVMGVFPPGLHKGFFTTAAVDNLDHNPSSTAASDAFHGTAISVAQHGVPDDISTDSSVTHSIANFSDNSKTVTPLPVSYTQVKPVVQPKKDITVPQCAGSLSAGTDCFTRELVTEYEWLDRLSQLSVADDTAEIHLETQDYSWAAYHASRQPIDANTVSISTLLPLFRDPAHSPAMIRHAMSVVISATGMLSPGQVPVLTLDQPLYTIAKIIQWNWPDQFGESHLLLMLGGLHTEMAALKALGDLLDGSGWTTALVNANVITDGRADALLHASHVTRTRRAHQVTACALYILQKQAYTHLVDSDSAGDRPEFAEWCASQAKVHPMFQYWSMVLRMQMTVLLFVRSLRQSDFGLYTEILQQLIPWFFVFNRQNYSRWAAVHARDMITLAQLHPALYEEFVQGRFTFHKTKLPFSAIALDHAHEQLNARVKGVGGAVGLTEKPDALLRWMIGGPEVARVVAEFEQTAGLLTNDDLKGHHEQTKSQQTAFCQHVLSLVSSFENLGNPFMDDSGDLFALDTTNMCSADAVRSVQTIESVGKQKYSDFVKERFVECTKPISAQISRCKLPLFKQSNAKVKTAQHSKLAAAKNDCSLFSRLYIACQTRSGDLDDFFAHENQLFPPALSCDGKLRSGSKSDLLPCLENLVVLACVTPDARCLVVDGAAVVQMQAPCSGCRTFEDYATLVFIPYINRMLCQFSRIDIVWDQYLPVSLKAGTRVKRGKGVRRRVTPTADLPRNWSDFLHVSENKSELFHFLSHHVTNFNFGDREVFITDGSNVLSNTVSRIDTSISPCSHEEADTRLLLHVAHAANCGFTKVTVRTVDTDVVVIAIACMQQLVLPELWIWFGTGKHIRYLPVHDIVTALGPDRCMALPFFHAFTGCDTVSAFLGRGKKSAWDTWLTFTDVTTAFTHLSAKPDGVDLHMPLIERFTVLLYDRTSSKMTVNESRKQLFSKKGRKMQDIPPSQAALLQHVKRAAYQSGYCWHTALQPEQNLPCPTNWGWIKSADSDVGWQPFWTTLPDVANCCPQLLKCACKKGCDKRRCKCAKAELPCTALCFCEGDCISD